MKKYFHIGALLIIFFGSPALTFHSFNALAADAGSPEWKAEFDRICAKTNDAMTLPEGELKSLIEECDKLRPKIEALDESTKKVYLKRLKSCKDLFSYVLETKQTKKPAAQ